MSDFQGIAGYFDRKESLDNALRQAQAAGLTRLKAYLPVGSHRSINRLQPRGSGVRWVALGGGLTGITVALAMTIWMSWDYPLITGGKPITSMPPFLVVAFELMVLLGGISAVVGYILLSGLPALRPSDAYTPNLAVDQFALFVSCAEASAECARADTILREAGAINVQEIRHKEYGPLQEVE